MFAVLSITAMFKNGDNISATYSESSLSTFAERKRGLASAAHTITTDSPTFKALLCFAAVPPLGRRSKRGSGRQEPLCRNSAERQFGASSKTKNFPRWVQRGRQDGR